MSFLDNLKNSFLKEQNKIKKIKEKKDDAERSFKSKFEEIVHDEQFQIDLNDLMAFFDKENKANQKRYKCGYHIEGTKLQFYRNGYSFSLGYISLEKENNIIVVGDYTFPEHTTWKFNLKDMKRAQKKFLEIITQNMAKDEPDCT